MGEINDGQDHYEYYVCEFIGYCNDKGESDMDILPYSWIELDEQDNKLKVPYPSPPYTSQIFERLHKKVQRNSEPSKSWPKWEVSLKGGANSYQKAEERLSRLKADSYAFSTDCEDQKSRADDAKNAFKNESLKDILADETSNHSNDSESEEIQQSSSEDEAKKKIFHKRKGVRGSKKLKNSSGMTNQKKKRVKPRKPRSKPQEMKTPPLEKSVSIDDLESMNDDELLRLTDNTIKKITSASSSNNHEDFRQKSRFTQVRNPVINDKTANNGFSPALNNKKPNQLMPVSSINNNDKGLRGCNRITTMINASTVDETSNGFSPGINAILKAVVGVKLLVQKVQIDLNDLKKKVLGSDMGRLNETLLNHQLQLPLRTADEWLRFCDLLRDDNSLQEYLSLFMKQQVDKVGNNPTKSCTNISRKLFEKDLILKFTALKKVVDRQFVFNPSTCFQILEMVVLSSHRDSQGDFITEQVFKNSLSAAFSNSKDWGGRTTIPEVDDDANS